MNVGSELLWKATSAILLCFLVARLLSLLLSFSPPATQLVTEERHKRILTIDHGHDHHIGHKKRQKKNKTVKLLDEAAKVVDFSSFDAAAKDFLSENLVVVSDGKEEEGVFWDDEGWEGIERSELQREFGRARVFVEFADKERRFSMVDNNVIMQLYGLMKVAMEGSCYEPQPMAFKLSARAKWNAWKRLGNMSPDEAMKKYILVLSDIVPGWIDSHSSAEIKRSSKEEAHILLGADTNVHLAHKRISTGVRTSQLSDLKDNSMPVDKGKDDGLNIIGS